MKSWLLPGIVSCMVLCQQPNYGLDASYHLTPGGLYRLVKVLRVVKMVESMQKMESIEYLQTKLSIKTSTVKTLVFLCVVMLLLHNISCSWFLTARLEDHYSLLGDSDSGHCGVWRHPQLRWILRVQSLTGNPLQGPTAHYWPQSTNSLTKPNLIGSYVRWAMGGLKAWQRRQQLGARIREERQESDL